jgi:hypothetical protein
MREEYRTGSDAKTKPFETEANHVFGLGLIGADGGEMRRIALGMKSLAYWELGFGSALRLLR